MPRAKPQARLAPHAAAGRFLTREAWLRFAWFYSVPPENRGDSTSNYVTIASIHILPSAATKPALLDSATSQMPGQMWQWPAWLVCVCSNGRMMNGRGNPETIRADLSVLELTGDFFFQKFVSLLFPSQPVPNVLIQFSRFIRDKYWSFLSVSTCILIAIFNVHNTHINVCFVLLQELFFLLTSVALPVDNVYGP